MGDGWGAYGPPSSWRMNQPSFLEPQLKAFGRRTAEDIFKEWEQQDIDKGLVVYTDYKLDLDRLLGLMAHQQDEDARLEHILDPKLLDSTLLQDFRMIQHLTLKQVKRVSYLEQQQKKQQQQRPFV